MQIAYRFYYLKLKPPAIQEEEKIDLILLLEPLALKFGEFVVDFIRLFFPKSEPKISQNRIVSSALADTIVLPSGERPMCNTLLVWPLNSLICGIFK